jgi:drug/metabolite transporter (DMT)-like permease
MTDISPVDRPLNAAVTGALTSTAATPRSLLGRDFALWSAFLALDTCTQIAFKTGGGALAGIDFGPAWFDRFVATPAIWIGITGYIVAFVLWIAILQGSELTRAFTLQGVTFATVPIGGWLFFGEHISLERAFGIALIIGGVTLISRRRASP